MPFDQKLLVIFFDYLEKVVEIKQSVEKKRNSAIFGNTDADGKPETTEIMGKRQAAVMVSRHLTRHLQCVEEDIKRSYGSYERKIFLHVQFVLAALTDELFIFDFMKTDPLPWTEVIIERALYGTGCAGTSFFKKVNRLVKSQQDERELIVLAKIYLLALRLGFKGMYRTAPAKGGIVKVKDALVAYIGEGDLFTHLKLPQTAHEDQRESSRNRMISTRPWMRLLLAIIVFYLAVSSSVWVTSLHTLNLAIRGVSL